MNRPWTKPPVRVLVCLVAGAVVTVAVAWACVALAPRDRIAILVEPQWGRGIWVDEYGGTGWRQYLVHRSGIWARWPQESEYARERQREWGKTVPHIVAKVPNLRECSSLWDADIRVESPRVSFTLAGWPLGALAAEEGLTTDGGTHRYGWAAPRLSERALPLRPVPAGFALNTALYATLLFTLWTTPAPIRRHLRRRRGHCPACNYDLRGLTTPCPECGRQR